MHTINIKPMHTDPKARVGNWNIQQDVKEFTGRTVGG